MNINLYNKITIIATIMLVFFALIIGFYFIMSLGSDKDRITKIINKKYASYEIKEIKLEYVDWSSTISDAEQDNHKATQATVIIANEDEQMTIKFKKRFNMWLITNSYYDYGENLANDIYYVEIDYSYVGKSVDFDEYIESYDVWVIPDKEGRLYKKSGSGDGWYYSYMYYKDIYKTQDGFVYVFNKRSSSWEKSDKNYSDLQHYGNYTKIDKEEAIEILKKYSSYTDN